MSKNHSFPKFIDPDMISVNYTNNYLKNSTQVRTCSE